MSDFGSWLLSYEPRAQMHPSHAPVVRPRSCVLSTHSVWPRGSAMSGTRVRAKEADG
jgi:hypothetical protein